MKLKKDAIVITGFHGTTPVITSKEKIKSHHPRKEYFNKESHTQSCSQPCSNEIGRREKRQHDEAGDTSYNTLEPKDEKQHHEVFFEEYGKDMMVDVIEYQVIVLQKVITDYFC